MSPYFSSATFFVLSLNKALLANVQSGIISLSFSLVTCAPWVFPNTQPRPSEPAGVDQAYVQGAPTALFSLLIKVENLLQDAIHLQPTENE